MEPIAIAFDALALLSVAWVLWRRGVARWRRAVAASAACACAVISPMLVAQGSVPQWTRIVMVCAMFASFCAVAAVVSPIGGTPDDDDSGGLRSGDWDPYSPDDDWGPRSPQGGVDDSDPGWWPEFEREFADYVAQQLTPLRQLVRGAPVASATSPSVCV
jgi:hypothetical protein